MLSQKGEYMLPELRFSRRGTVAFTIEANVIHGRTMSCSTNVVHLCDSIIVCVRAGIASVTSARIRLWA